MASIASIYVEVLPSTATIATAIEKALRSVDAKRIGREMGRDLERGAGDVTVEVDADVKKAEAKLKKLEKDEPTVHVNVDVKDADLAKAKAKLASLGKGEALTAAVGLAPNLVPMLGQAIQGAGQLSGVLGVIPAAYGGYRAGFLTLRKNLRGFLEPYAFRSDALDMMLERELKLITGSGNQTDTADETESKLAE